MIVLDTNVVSEPMKLSGSPAVRDWLDTQASETLYLTATSLSELLVGIESTPTGRRKNALRDALGEMLHRFFAGRILPFDAAAASAYASLVCRAKTMHGHNVSVGDGQIAAIATANRFVVATRDVKPFRAMGVTVINPWDAGESTTRLPARKIDP